MGTVQSGSYCSQVSRIEEDFRRKVHYKTVIDRDRVQDALKRARVA